VTPGVVKPTFQSQLARQFRWKSTITGPFAGKVVCSTQCIPECSSQFCLRVGHLKTSKSYQKFHNIKRGQKSFTAVTTNHQSYLLPRSGLPYSLLGHPPHFNLNRHFLTLHLLYLHGTNPPQNLRRRKRSKIHFKMGSQTAPEPQKTQ
jgi:hypothetical protein